MYAINKGRTQILIPVFLVEVSRFISKEVSETLLYICLSHINDGANIIRIFKLRSLVSHFFSFFFVFLFFACRRMVISTALRAKLQIVFYTHNSGFP